MKNKRLWFTIVLALCIAMSGGAASAHTFESDNGVNGILHVAPDDAPVTGRRTLLKFYLSSERSDFRLYDTGYSLTVSLGSRRISQPAVRRDGSVLTSTVTFPAAGNYGVVLDGHGFRLAFDTGVAAGATPPGVRTRGLEVLALSAASLAALASIAVQNIVKGGRYRPHP